MSKKPALEMLDEMEEVKFIVGGMVVGSRKKVIALVYSMELTSLQQCGPKQMKKYWKRVEDLPRKEKYMRVIDPMKLPIEIFAVPNLRADLLAFRIKGADENEVYNKVEQYLEEKLNTAMAAKVAEDEAREAEESYKTESASAAPAPTQPSPIIEFPLHRSSTVMTCHIEFEQPVLMNSKSPLDIVNCVLEKFDQLRDFQFLVPGKEATSRQKIREQYLNVELDYLKKNGPKSLGEYWQHVETLPSRETFQPGKTHFGDIFQLMATPTLRSDLLALRGRETDIEKEHALIINFLEMQLKG